MQAVFSPLIIADNANALLSQVKLLFLNDKA